jgi:hypothetical protein
VRVIRTEKNFISKPSRKMRLLPTRLVKAYLLRDEKGPAAKLSAYSLVYMYVWAKSK